MKNPISLRCDMHGTVQELPAFFEQLEAWAQACEVPPRRISRFGLMLDELLTNVAMHAYREQGGAVSVQVDLLPPQTLQAVIRDQGPAFDPTGACAPDLEMALEEREVGGLGLHFVRRMAHRFTYRRDGDSNELTLGLVGE